jgi:hypothetical protein
MSWQDEIKGDPLPWLLEPESPGVRYLAMRDLLGLPEDDAQLSAARHKAHQAGPIAAILAQMDDTGYWVKPGPGYNPKYRSGVWSLILLAQMGARLDEDARLEHACRHLIDHALAPGGQLSTSGTPSTTIDCLQGNLCWALVEIGFDDPRLEACYEWMARSVTGEGVASLEDKTAPLRYYAYKCGPLFACGANYGLSCAWGAAKVMLAFSRWPAERRTPLIENAIQAGVDFLFSTDPAIADYPSGGTGKPSGNWWKFGFPVFYVTDILQVVEALATLGYGNDPRLANALRLIKDKQDDLGRWSLEYEYSGKTWVDIGEKKHPNKWVTLRALRVLKSIG